jgi:hypothetical protein
VSGLRQNPRQTFRCALARHPVDAAGQTLKPTRLRNRYPQQTDDIVDQNPLQDGGTQVFPPDGRGTGLRLKDDGGGVNDVDLNREKLSLEVLYPAQRSQLHSRRRKLSVGIGGG